MNAPDIHASQQTDPTGISRYSNPAFSAACTTRSYSSTDPGNWASGTPYAVVSPWVGRYHPNSSGRMNSLPRRRIPRPVVWKPVYRLYRNEQPRRHGPTTTRADQVSGVETA